MKKTIVMLLLFVSFVFAENFSNMSTQELIAIMGYVKPQNQKAFMQELQSRISTMNSREKKNSMTKI
jgi:hypothetical protein